MTSNIQSNVVNFSIALFYLFQIDGFQRNLFDLTSTTSSEYTTVIRVLELMLNPQMQFSVPPGAYF